MRHARDPGAREQSRGKHQQHRQEAEDGEGDGVGVLTDIPRLLWAQALEQEGKPGWLAEDRRFFVGHLMIPNTNTDFGTEAAVLRISSHTFHDRLALINFHFTEQGLGFHNEPSASFLN